MSQLLFKFPRENLGEPAVGHPMAERLVEGNPVQRTWDFAEAASNDVVSGVWESEPGAWLSIKGEAWEFCHILEGFSLIEEEGKAPVELRAGDTFVMRPGFVGTWRVIERTRKLYVIKAR